MKRIVRIAGGVTGGAAAAALAAVMAAGPASAQKVVVFGDSLSDTGNAQVATGGTNPGSPYGRYSNGLNWVDQLYGTGANGIGLNPASAISGLNPNSFAFSWVAGGNPPAAYAGANVLDFAFGGAYTGTGNVGNILVTLPSGQKVPYAPDATGLPAGSAPGIAQEIQLYLLTTGGVASPTALYTMWGGANNGFYALGVTPSLTGLTGAAALAASDEKKDLQALVSAGAKNFLVLNIPNLGSTPSVAANGPAGVQGGNLYSTTFNTLLQQNVQALAGANPGVNFIQADVNAAVRIVLANPGAFGFTNTTAPCGFGSVAGGGGAACAGYFFADGVHPSQAAYAVLDLYLAQLLNTAPALQQVARLGQSGIYSNEVVSNAVFDRLSGFVSGSYVGKNGPYVEVLGAYANYNNSGSAPGLSQAIGGIRGGIDKRTGATLAGASVAFLDGSESTGAIKNDLQSWRADIYGTALYGNAYISGDAGISSLDLNGISRDTGFPTVAASGHTQGYVATVAAEVGYVAQMGGLAIIPSGRATYFHSQINGYSETAPILAMSYNDQIIDTVALAGKVRVASNLPGIGLAAVGFVEGGYEGFVSTSTSSLRGQLVGNTALPTIVNPGDPMSPGILGKVGLSTQISANAFVDFQYGIAVHDEGGQTHSGDLRIKATY